MERVDVEQRAEKARRFFLEGYNCAQAVVLAYCDLFDISPSLAASISAPLGGGMGRLREVCGAVSGMFMVAGLFYKNDVEYVIFETDFSIDKTKKYYETLIEKGIDEIVIFAIAT